LIGRSENCSLDLLFRESCVFSLVVSGTKAKDVKASLFLAGYFMPYDDDEDDDDDDDDDEDEFDKDDIHDDMYDMDDDEELDSDEFDMGKAKALEVL